MIKNEKNVKRGTKAQIYGRSFEHIFYTNCKYQALATTKFPDGCKQIGPHRLIRVKTPWDFILSFAGKTAFIDTKTTHSDVFANSHIQDHQVREMYNHELQGAVAGYVILFRDGNEIHFIKSSELIKNIGQRGSIKCPTESSIFLGSLSDFDCKKIFFDITKNQL